MVCNLETICCILLYTFNIFTQCRTQVSLLGLNLQTNLSNALVVSELVPALAGSCHQLSKTILPNNKIICAAASLVEDNFNNNNIGTTKWTIENYIPFNSPDYEFVSYQNSKTNCYIKNNQLYLRPIAAVTEDDINGELNLTIGCTRQSESECYTSREGIFILPPVTSARIVSKLPFKYGEVEIKAKLPSGDWIYPQLYLEQIFNPKHKLWIAYARGNNRLIDNKKIDIGSRLLLGGPVLDPEEPNRSKYLSSKISTFPFTDDPHVFKVIWKEDSISLLVDAVPYGEIDKSRLLDTKFAENDFVRLVLGVGVGGINDFPDDFRSGNSEKPWKNRERAQVKKFFTARNSWINTWDRNNSALIVDYVKIKAL